MSLIRLLRKNSRKFLFTTPSHGQKFFIFSKFRQFYKYDISETDAHDPQKALSDAQERAKHIYNTKYTYFLTNGSTSGIIASVLTCTEKGDKVLIWRNAHPSHENAVKLAGCEVVYYDLPVIENWGIPDKTTPDLIDMKGIKAVIVTSPSYEGVTSDIKSLKKVCEKNNAYLIVDEAHGALYPFSDKLPQSAVNIADFTIQSLHKTAGGLNPTALLHVNCDLNAEASLSMISTTSPSYPLLASIEANINYLNSAKGRKQLNSLILALEKIRKNVKNIDFGGNDMTKLLIKKEGMSGYELSQKLFDTYNIEDEKTNEISTMLLCGIGTSDKKLEHLRKALLKL
ncbi:orn/Lys/Arg decarboxylase major domain protein [Fusobacterium sp. CAG:439]|nr:orn/Lys/Arg decarboxylase major domain protein [Fusobacterium sp. CAG:439]